MFRCMLLASAGVLALAGTALAADPPIFTWTGFYVGINAGGTFANRVNTTTGNVFGNPALGNGVVYGVGSAELATFGLSSSTGFIGGGQIGYNYQIANSFVAGIEADFQGVADSTRTRFSRVKIAGGPTEFLEQTAVLRGLSYLGTVRGRLGFLFTPTLLVYGTGGLAYGGGSSTSITQFITAAPAVPNPYSSFVSSSGPRAGWTAGAGGEWLFTPHWSVKAEYLYYDIRGYGLSPLENFNTAGTLFTSNTPRASFRGNIVRVGLNIRW